MPDGARIYQPGFFARLLPSGRWKLTLTSSSRTAIHLQSGNKADLACLDIIAISVAKGFLWHYVEIQSRSRTDRVSGLRRSTAAELATDLYNFVNEHLFDVIGSETEALNVIEKRLRIITEDQPQYLARSDLALTTAGISEQVSAALSHPLLDADRIPKRLKDKLPLTFDFLINPETRSRYNKYFVSAELVQSRSFFDDLDGRSLSDQQREACIRLEDSNLLIASAGSGKSATMVGKVAYILEKQICRPDEILVLAFNKNAADELAERISRQLGQDPTNLECRVTTFHALGRGIIEKVQGHPPQLANWVEHPAGEAKVIEQIIEDLLGSDVEFANLWVDLLLLHPQADIPVQMFDTQADYERYLALQQEGRSATIGTLAGIYVKSLQERTIANWLWLHSVTFEYERQIGVEDENGQIRHLHPDFYYPSVPTIHEHLAINANGSSPFADYIAHAESKLAAYRKANIDVFQTTSAQANNGSLVGTLEAELTKRGIQLERKSYSAIVKALEPIVIKHYHNLVSTCIKHVRSGQLTLDTLLARAQELNDPIRGKKFARAVWTISDAYSRKLNHIRRIDFDSMIADAAQLVKSGLYQSPFSLILVDEFQDISESRAKLLKALQQQRPCAKIFAVGDDWQSIYRFAGSDITVFTQFEAHFGTSWQGRLEQTYRCNQLIAETAANFIQRNPGQLQKSVRSARPAIARSIRVIPIKADRGKPEFTTACLRLLKRLDTFLDAISEQWRSDEHQKLKVMVLWRYNQLDPFKASNLKFANIAVSGLSFHRAKGLEADYTILLDVSEGDYGVPSQIEDDELINLVMPHPENFEYAEERRLFYVALTRASRGVFVLTNVRSPSRYICELSEIAGDNLHFETIDGVALDKCPVCHLGHLVKRKGRNNRWFLGCSQFPICNHTASLK